RYGISTCAIGNKVFFAGGIINENTKTSRVDIYDLTTSTWSQRELSQSGRFVSVIIENKVWFVTHGSNQIDIYDPITDNWSTSLLGSPVYSSQPAVIYNHAAITLGNKVYFTGSQTVRVYDIPTQSWSNITLSENRFFIPAAISNGKIAFIGGMTSWFIYSSVINIYDPFTNSWSIQYMSSDLYYASFISYNNYIYSAGGIINQENTSLSGICRFQL
ncbi:MAG: kelch repeat-containing protein, partial [Chitinophagaceae bacterium]